MVNKILIKAIDKLKKCCYGIFVKFFGVPCFEEWFLGGVGVLKYGGNDVFFWWEIAVIGIVC